MWAMLIQCCWLPRVSVSCLLQRGACLEALPRNSSEPFQLLTRNRSELFQHVFAANQGNEQLVPEPFWTVLNRSAANSATEPFWTVPHLPWTDCLEPFWTVPAWHLQSVTFKPSLVMLKLSCTSVYILCMCKVYQIHIYVYIYIYTYIILLQVYKQIYHLYLSSWHTVCRRWLLTNITISTCVCVAKMSVYSRENSDSISATVVFVEANRTIALFNVMRASCHMVGFEVKWITTL